jgi:hypothetical protein
MRQKVLACVLVVLGCVFFVHLSRHLDLDVVVEEEPQTPGSRSLLTSRFFRGTDDWNVILCIASVWCPSRRALVVYTQGLDSRSVYNQTRTIPVVTFCLVDNQRFPVSESQFNVHVCLLPNQPAPGVPVTLVSSQDQVLESDAFVILPREVKNKNKVCAATQIKSEAKYVRHWLDYHFKLGLEYMHFNDNNSTDDLQLVLKQYDEQMTQSVFWPWKKSQPQAYSFARVFLESSCDWVFFMDLDQYIYSNESLPNALGRFDHSAVQVCLFSKQYHHSGLVTCPDVPLPLIFTSLQQQEVSTAPNCATRVSNASFSSHIHHFDMVSGSTVRLGIDSNKYFSHYSLRCWEDFRAKFFKGRNGLVNDWKATGSAITGALPKDWVFSSSLKRDLSHRDFYLQLMHGPETP